MKRIFIIIIGFSSIFTFGKQPKVDAFSGATWQKPQKINGTISGKVTEKNTRNNLAYANVSIINPDNQKTIEGTVTSERGKFNFEEIQSGKYILSISFIGYNTKEIPFEITSKNPNLKFKTLSLTPTSKTINEIEINEEKAVYENKIDKIVYNPGNDINQSADDATDVLRKAPLLSVDLDGNVSLRGSSNIKFLINGKASTFLTSDISSALTMIPADQIKSVEVITSPGAKYDGEGDAGIVNIITKKKIIDGYKGTISGSIGKRVSRNSLNLTAGKNNFGISSKGGLYGMYWPRKGKTNYVRNDWINGDTNNLTRIGETFSRWTGYRTGIDMFYDLNPFNNFTSSFSFGGRDKFSDDTTNISYTSLGENDEYQSIINTNSTNNNVEWTIDYTKKFINNPERELVIAFQMDKGFEDEGSSIFEKNELTKNISDGISNDKTFQIDYTHPFGEKKSTKKKIEDKIKKIKQSRGKRNGYKGKEGSSVDDGNKLEIGVKYIDRNNNFDYETIIDSNNIRIYSDNDVFDYRQRVASGYMSSQFTFSKNIGLVIGGRYEFTDIHGKWKNKSIQNFDSKTYGNFLPNLVLSKKFSMTKSLKLSYNKRIRRPSSYYINPNIGRTDNKNIIIGNPNLRPAISEQIEIGYNSFGNFLQSSYYIYLKNTKDVIESIVSIEDQTSITNYENIGLNNKLGFNYYGSIMLKSINLRAGFNIFQYSSNDDRYGDISEWLYNYNFGGTVDLGNRLKFETWGWYSSPNQTIQGYSDSWSMMSFGIKKDFKNKRGSLGIRVVEPFLKNGEKVMRTMLRGENFEQDSERTITMRSVGISFSYTFGKLNFKEKRVNSKINNNDLMEGGNSDQ
ncbi:MAG: hypothetical protein CMD22_07175 [Flavobacteriales bacterium]|nr:hypothetical protein [Flavobacteriales bacterium]|tara:strand:- start:649 stop:3201 length:2553 start_codon:yes stop_codon:yes gene_type:complete